MKRTPHPLYSLGLAPCDFYIFEYIKGRLAGASFEEPDPPLQATDAIFSPLKKHVLGADGQIDAMVCGSWWFSRRHVKKSEDDLSFARPVSRF
jgi:hypothetical protein